MMNFRAFLAPLRRWWWLVLGTTVIACISSFLLLREVPSIYQAGHAYGRKDHGRA